MSIVLLTYRTDLNNKFLLPNLPSSVGSDLQGMALLLMIMAATGLALIITVPPCYNH